MGRNRRALALAPAVLLAVVALTATAACSRPSTLGAPTEQLDAAGTTSTEATTTPPAPAGPGREGAAGDAGAAEAATSTAPPATAAPAPPPPPTTVAATTAPAPVAVVAPPPTVRAEAVAPQRVVGDIGPYTGLGTWVDVYDWSHYHDSTPTVGPDQVDEMAAQGVQTLFLQTAKHDTPDPIAEQDLLLPIIDRAHAHHIDVVAWYLPTLEDVDNDLNRIVASANLDVDGIAVDIESRKVADVNERNARLIDLVGRLRPALPGRAIGAIVMPPVQTEVINPGYWPNFPWREIAPSFDVWQTMGYWTDRKASSGYRDPYRYTAENMQRLRNNLGNPSAAISPVGGVGGMGNGDIDAFLRAAVENGAIGGSIYDFRTTRPEAWPTLRGFRAE